MPTKKIFAHLKNNFILGGFLILGFISILLSFSEQTKGTPPMNSSPVDERSADTYIPRGYVLVPIEITNAESLTSLVGDMGGVVDLYLANSEQQKGGLKVGSKLKLLRAPLNPQQYAVLVREQESTQILRYSGPFIAVIQNPQASGNQVTSSGPAKLRIDYQN